MSKGSNTEKEPQSKAMGKNLSTLWTKPPSFRLMNKSVLIDKALLVQCLMGSAVTKAPTSYVTPDKSWFRLGLGVFFDRRDCETMFFVVFGYSLTVYEILSRLNTPVFSSDLVFVL